jgi:hypothetical protein
VAAVPSGVSLHNDSCHPNEHKKASINYLINSMNQYPLTHSNRKKEKKIIREILNNKYN